MQLCPSSSDQRIHSCQNNWGETLPYSWERWPQIEAEQAQRFCSPDPLWLSWQLQLSQLLPPTSLLHSGLPGAPLLLAGCWCSAMVFHSRPISCSAVGRDGFHLLLDGLPGNGNLGDATWINTSRLKIWGFCICLNEDGSQAEDCKTSKIPVDQHKGRKAPNM